MTRYSSGSNWERLVKKFFELTDMQVIRSAGSKGSIDLICFNEIECVVIQCKSAKKSRKFNLTTQFNDDIEKMKNLKAPIDWRRQIWLKQGKQIYIYHVDTQQTDVVELAALKKVIERGN